VVKFAVSFGGYVVSHWKGEIISLKSRHAPAFILHIPEHRQQGVPVAWVFGFNKFHYYGQW